MKVIIIKGSAEKKFELHERVRMTADALKQGLVQTEKSQFGEVVGFTKDGKFVYVYQDGRRGRGYPWHPSFWTWAGDEVLPKETP